MTNQIHEKAIFNSRLTAYFSTSIQKIKFKLVQLYALKVSLKRIKNLLQNLGLPMVIRKKFKLMTTNSYDNFLITPNIINIDIYSSSINLIYVGDITYIPISKDDYI